MDASSYVAMHQDENSECTSAYKLVVDKSVKSDSNIAMDAKDRNQFYPYV